MLVPVGRTIGGAYGFALGRFISVVGTAWLPYVVLILYCSGVLLAIAPSAPVLLPGAGTPAFLGGLALVTGFLITNAMVTVGVMREALGLHPRPVYFYFSLGLPVWRMLVATVVSAAIIVGARFVVLAIAQDVIAATARTVPASLAAWVQIGVWLLALIALIYLLARLLFFLPAVVVAERRIGIARSWHLGWHNVFRIVLAGAAIYIPVPVIFAMLASLLATGSLQAALDFRTLNQSIPDYLQHIHPPGAAGIVLQILYSLLVFGLSSGSAASAYRAVVPASAANARPLPPAEGNPS